jgi:hypothetical protein
LIESVLLESFQAVNDLVPLCYKTQAPYLPAPQELERFVTQWCYQAAEKGFGRPAPSRSRLGKLL